MAQATQALMPEAQVGKIIVLCPGGTVHGGGIGRLMAYVAEAWRRMDRPPDFVLIDTRGPGSVIFSPFYLLWAIARIVWLRLTSRVWVVHANISKGAGLFRKTLILPLVRLLGIPIVVHHHGGAFLPSFRAIPGPLRALVRSAISRGACTIVLGRYWRDVLIRELRLPSDRVVTLFNAVPAPPAHRPHPRGDCCRLLFVGRLEPQKGVDDLLNALAAPQLRSLGWSLSMAGSGDEDRYRAMARSLGIADRIQFLGLLDRAAVDDLYASSDILLLPSHFEAMPLALLEALGAGVPSIVTPVGAVPEIVEDGKSALLVPCGSPPALADAIARLVRDPRLRREIAANGRAVFESNLSIDKYARSLLDIYRAFAQPANGRAASAHALVGSE